MRGYESPFGLFLFLCMNVCLYGASPDKALVVDLTNDGAPAYTEFMALADSVGFQTRYVTACYLRPADIASAQTLFLVLDPLFLRALASQTRWEWIEHTMQMLRTFVACKEKTLMLLLPNSKGLSAALYGVLALFLKKIGYTFHDQPSMQADLKRFLHVLCKADILRTVAYETAMYRQQFPERRTQHAPACEQDLRELHAYRSWSPGVLLLPAQSSKTESSPADPLALMVNSEQARLCISRQSMFLFGGIAGNCFVDPVDASKRENLYRKAQRVLCDIRQPGVSSPHPCPALPVCVSSVYDLQQKKKVCTLRPPARPLVCGWMELESFAGKETGAAQCICDAGLTLLWFSFNPERFYSKRAIAPDQQNRFEQSVTTFTSALAACYRRAGKPLPEVFVGLDVTTNFAQKEVVHCAVDQYGMAYPKIPVPLDVEHFWKPEVLDVFDAFVAMWRVRAPQVPLAGVFFDFEMYHAPEQAAEYTNHGDFSDISWQAYASHVGNNAIMKIPAAGRFDYLWRHQQCAAYRVFLQQQAHRVGVMTREHMQRTLPGCRFAAYTIGLPLTWYYCGMLAGLSTPVQPIVLATFNNRFFSYYDWLTQQDIQAYHLPVMLLSKFHCAQDFERIQALMPHHDGIWINRFSRLIEGYNPDPKVWYDLEQTPLQAHEFATHVKNAVTRSA